MAPNLEHASFSAPTETHSFKGLLFDMDGTIIDSTNAIVKHWTEIGKELGVDPNIILATSHGRRSVDVLKEYDPSKANWEYVSHAEGQVPKKWGSDAIELPGSRALLEALENTRAPWAIVTSGTRPLVTGWLNLMNLAHPKNLVVAEDVERGKPDPACYLLGQKRLGLPREASCIVFEDAPSGIRAGKAAGFKVLAVATSHEIKELQDAGADWIVKDLSSVKLKSFKKETGDVMIEILNPFEA